MSDATMQVIEKLQSWLSDDLKAVNEAIISNMQSSVDLIPQLASHLISAGGKRFRPLLTLLSARALGYQGSRHIELAACIEFIHTATLLHDDVVDESNIRRGLQSANVVWGNQASVLVGDFLFSRAFRMMVGEGSPQVLALLSDTAVTIAEGEVDQLRLQNACDSGEALYLRVIRGKTAVLFAASCAVSALLNGSRDDADDYKNLYGYGLNLGMAFQLIDDILDYSANEQALGKQVGDDFSEGKVTLPLIFAWESADSSERDFLRRSVGELRQEDGDFAIVSDLLAKYDCLSRVRTCAESYAEEARLCLGRLSVSGESRSQEFMVELVDFCLQRGY